MAVITSAQGARSQLLYKVQGAFGTVATGNFTTLRYNTHSLSQMIDTVESPELRSDREVVDLRHGNSHAAGDIVTPLIYGEHDSFIESAMFSTFDTDSVAIGTTPQYLSIEDGAVDIGQYRMFYDMAVSTWRVQVQTGAQAILLSTFSMMGAAANAWAPSSSGGTPVAAGSNQPFDSFTGGLWDNAVESGNELATISTMDFTVNNGINPTYAIGQQLPVALEYGRGRVTGNLTAYFTNSLWLNRFRNESTFALSLSVTDPDGNIMEFLMPRVKLTSADVPVANEQSRLITSAFVALRDPTLGYSFQVSKA